MCGGFIGSIAKGLGLAHDAPTQDPADAASQAAASSQAAADTKATQSANLKLAYRNRRRSASLLATGAGDTGMAQGKTTRKSVLGA
jgi:hypothetical protein